MSTFSNFKSLYLKIIFSPICYDVIDEITTSREHNIRFQKFLYQNWAERSAIYEIAKSQFWTSDPTGLFLMCWLTFIEVIPVINYRLFWRESWVFSIFCVNAATTCPISLMLVLVEVKIPKWKWMKTIEYSHSFCIIRSAEPGYRYERECEHRSKCLQY